MAVIRQARLDILYRSSIDLRIAFACVSPLP
jgi:hypothetical protein